MKLYSGVDLHSNNHVVAIIDEQDERVFQKRLPNDLDNTLRILEPFKPSLQGIAVESTFNWYWLVDGLMEAGYPVYLVNTSAIKQYEGLKHTDDPYDAFWLAPLNASGDTTDRVHLPESTTGRARSAAKAYAIGPAPHYPCASSVQSQYWRSRAADTADNWGRVLNCEYTCRSLREFGGLAVGREKVIGDAVLGFEWEVLITTP